jgi:hypothetical protein
MILWKLGIPDWARRTLWPISIGDRLEFTETLFKILVDLSESAYDRKKNMDNWACDMYIKIENDLNDLKDYFVFL